jgi:hypothetical protein
MTVTTQASKIIYQGNGATTAFSFTFEIPEASDAFVYFTDTDGTQTLVNSATYSIVGLGNSAGGTLTYPLVGSAIAVGTKLTIQRVMPLTQEVDLVNQDGFYPEVVESGLDTLEFQIQQLQEQYSRAIVFPVSDINFDNDLPTQAQRAGLIFGFDSAGNPTAVSTLPTNIVSAAMIPVVEAATIADAQVLLGIGGDLTATSLLFTGTPSLVVVPTGNDIYLTKSELSIQATTQTASAREWLVNIGLTSNLGTGTVYDKVGLYVGVEAQSGTADVWNINTVMQMDASSGSYNVQCYELDLNNNNANRGEGLGVAGLSAPVANALTISGAGSFRSTSAISIEGPGTAIWNRGILIVLDSVKQASFQDLGNADISIEIQGNHADYGIDMAAATFGGAAIRAPNNSTINFAKAGGGPDLQAIGSDGSNNIFIAPSNTAGVFVGEDANVLEIGPGAASILIGSGGGVAVEIDWVTTLTLAAPGFSHTSKGQTGFFPVTIPGHGVVNILTGD